MGFKFLPLFIFIIIFSFILNADSKIVEKIVVIINDEIITYTEFDDRLEKTREMFKQVYKYSDSKLNEEIEKSKSQILDTMIDEILFVQEAMKRNIKISDADVSKEINALKKQFSSDKEFDDALKAEGYTLDSLKREKKRTLLLQELIKQKFASELNVTDDEVRKFYDENKAQFPDRKDTVKLKHLFIKFNLTQSDKDKAKQKAESVLKQCLDGADFDEMVEKYSDDLATKGNKGDMEYLIPGMWQFPEIEDTISKLAINQISDIIETPDGFEIIKVTEKKRDGKIRAKIIHIAILPDPAEEKSAEDKANSILNQLKNGADFVKIVKDYSDDKLSKDKDGDWMEVPIDNMGTDLQGAFDSFDVGNISKTIRSEQGFHIFKITEKKDLTSNEIEQIKRFLSDKKLQDKLGEYSKKLRDIAYIQRFEIDG